MTLKQIKLTNVQCHKELVIDLPEKGLVALCGENSNGKSVVVKVIHALCSGSLVGKPDNRASLINRNARFAEAEFIRYDNARLFLHLTCDAANTYLVLEMPGQEPVKRYLQDSLFKRLPLDFGFHYVPERGISLNIAEDDDALLFFKTSYRANFEIFNSVITDEDASRSLENLEELVKQCRQVKDVALTQSRTIASAINAMEFYDLEKERARYEKLTECLSILSTIYFPELPELEPVPDIAIYLVHTPEIPRIMYPKVYNVTCNIPDVTELMQEIKEIKENKCPMCGRRFIDEQDSQSTCCN